MDDTYKTWEENGYKWAFNTNNAFFWQNSDNLIKLIAGDLTERNFRFMVKHGLSRICTKNDIEASEEFLFLTDNSHPGENHATYS